MKGDTLEVAVDTAMIFQKCDVRRALEGFSYSAKDIPKGTRCRFLERHTRTDEFVLEIGGIRSLIAKREFDKLRLLK